MVEGRTGAAYADWLAARAESWRQHIRIAALDPFRCYLNALREHLPAATRVLERIPRDRARNEGR